MKYALPSMATIFDSFQITLDNLTDNYLSMSVVASLNLYYL